jgi:hypothetical protein
LHDGLEHYFRDNRSTLLNSAWHSSRDTGAERSIFVADRLAVIMVASKRLVSASASFINYFPLAFWSLFCIG